MVKRSGPKAQGIRENRKTTLGSAGAPDSPPRCKCIISFSCPDRTHHNASKTTCPMLSLSSTNITPRPHPSPRQARDTEVYQLPVRLLGPYKMILNVAFCKNCKATPVPKCFGSCTMLEGRQAHLSALDLSARRKQNPMTIERVEARAHSQALICNPTKRSTPEISPRSSIHRCEQLAVYIFQQNTCA